MLYIDDRNLVFIHIPKNAGQSIRNALTQSVRPSFRPMAQDLNVSQAEAERLINDGAGVDLPGLGRTKIEHLPLAFLRSHFHETWRVIEAATTFALVRAPRDRFLSALLQRLREYRGAGAIRADDPMVSEEAGRVCAWLDGRGPFSDMEFIHFARQVDYVDFEGERIVKAVFPIDRTDAVARWIEDETGLRIEVAHDHARREPKKWAGSMQPAARFIGRKLMPRPLKKAIYPLWVNSRLFANASSRYHAVRFGDEIERFIGDYYAADQALYDEAKARTAALADVKVA